MGCGYKGVNLPLIDNKAEPFKTMASLGDTEFCYNYNHKLIIKPIDKSLGYRDDELHPDVLEKINAARQDNRYPGQAFINALIDMQENRSVKRAVKFVEYRLLGTATYLEVFGEQAEEADERIKHYGDLKSLIDEIDVMHKENKQTQQLLINMAMALNELHLRVYK